MLNKLLSHVAPQRENETHSYSGLKVLELGCGAGDPVTLRLAAHSAIGSIIANDISSTMLTMLHSNLTQAGEEAESKIEAAEGDMMALDIGTGTLDAVIAYYSIIHLEQLDQLKMIALISKWLKPNTGHLLCCFASQESLGNLNEDWLGMRAFWSSHGAEGSIKMVEEAGLEVVLSETIHEHGDAEFLWVIARKLKTKG